MARVHLLVGQMRDGPGHAAAEIRRQGGVLEGLDEEQGGGDAAVEDGQFILVIDLAGAIPVYYSPRELA